MAIIALRRKPILASAGLSTLAWSQNDNPALWGAVSWFLGVRNLAFKLAVFKSVNYSIWAFLEQKVCRIRYATSEELKIVLERAGTK